MTTYRDALRQVILAGQVSQASLCRKAENVSPSLLSSYLEGDKDIGTDRLHALVNAMPPEMQADFYARVFSPENISSPDVADHGQQVLHIVRCFLAERRCDGKTFNDLIGVLAAGGGKVQPPAASSEDSPTGS